MAGKSAAAKIGVVGGLTGKRALFVTYLFESENGAEAARKAGIAPKRASTQAALWMRQAAVCYAIAVEARRRQKGEDTRIERLREHFANLAGMDVTEVIRWFEPDDGPPEPGWLGNGVTRIRKLSELSSAQRRWIKSVRQKVNQSGSWVEIEFHDPLRAAELFGKTLGIFIDPAQEGAYDAVATAEYVRRRARYEQEQQRLARERTAAIEHKGAAP